MRSVLFGALCLVALEAALSSGQAAQRAGGILSGAAGLVNRIFDPSVPLVPNRTGYTDPGNDQGPTSPPPSTLRDNPLNPGGPKLYHQPGPAV